MKRRTDGRYQKNISIGYDKDGRRTFKTVYGKTVKEIERKERELKNNMDLGVSASDEALTVGEWALEWLQTYQKNKTYNTYDMYKNSVKRHVIPNLGKHKLSDINSTVIGKVVNDYVAKDNIRTAEIFKLTMNLLMRQAYDDGYVKKLVNCRVKIKREEVQEKKPLSEEQVNIVKTANLNQSQRIFTELLFCTGVRRGEALALTKSDINFQKGCLTINKNLVFAGSTTQVKSPKSKAGYRELPLPQKFLRELYQYCSTLQGEILFPMRNGEYMTSSSFSKFWKGIIKELQINADMFNQELKEKCPWSTEEEMVKIDFSPHNFRHTYATNLFYAGVSPKVAQYLLGHSSIQVTLDIYTHLEKEKICESERDKIFDYIEKAY
jgi:integrase